MAKQSTWIREGLPRFLLTGELDGVVIDCGTFDDPPEPPKPPPPQTLEGWIEIYSEVRDQGHERGGWDAAAAERAGAPCPKKWRAKARKAAGRPFQSGRRPLPDS